jgi:hypothetical protein
MKALTVRNPYAWLIVGGMKPIENRSWSTKYRGPLLIHAAVSLHKDSPSEIEQRYGVSVDREQLSFGGIIGQVDLIDVVTHHNSPWFSGPYGFVLANARALPFRRVRGAQRLFQVPETWDTATRDAPSWGNSGVILDDRQKT